MGLVKRLTQSTAVTQWLRAGFWPNVIRRQCSVAFRHGRLADVIACKIAHTLRGGQRREGFAGIDLARRRDWFDARRTTYMRPAESYCLSNRVIKFVNRTSM